MAKKTFDVKTALILKLAVLTLAFLPGCSGTAKTLKLYPGLTAQAGYHIQAGHGVYENNGLKISVMPVEAEEATEDVKGFVNRKFIVLIMEIDNNTPSKVIYDPVHTVFTDDALDYKKPLDYTDLYEISDDASYQGKLSGLKDKFYDSTITIRPGDHSSRYLIFPPISSGVEKAGLTLSELYVGTEAAARISFPLVYREK